MFNRKPLRGSMIDATAAVGIYGMRGGMGALKGRQNTARGKRSATPGSATPGFRSFTPPAP